MNLETDWDDSPECAQRYAEDADGSCWGFEFMPDADMGMMLWDENIGRFCIHKCLRRGNRQWMFTLQKRPEVLT